MTVRMDAEKFKTKANELKQQATELMLTVEATGKMTPETNQQYENLMAQHDEQMKIYNRLEDFNKSLPSGNPAGNGGNNVQEHGTTLNINSGNLPGHFQVPGSQQKPRIENQREAFEQDPKFGYKNSEDFFESVIQFGKRIHDGQTLKNAANGDQRLIALSSLENALTTSSQYMNAQTSSGDVGVTGDMTGAVFVPIEFAPDMFKTEAVIPSGAMKTSRRTSKAMSVQKKYRLDKDHRTSVSGGFQVGRNFELACNRSSAAQYADMTVNLHALYGAYVASDLLMVSNPQIIAQEVEAGFRTEFESNRVKEILNGKQSGEYHGIWNSNALIKIAPVSGAASGFTVGSTTLTKEDVYKITERIWHTSDRSGMVWIAGLKYKTPIKMLMDTRLDGSNYFMYTNGGPDWADGMLDGYPIVFTEYAGDLGYAGGLGLYNMQEFEEYTWKPIRMASSMHAKFICNQQVFKFWTYSGGRPRWDSTLIPASVPTDADDATIAKNTLSPFVMWDGDEGQKVKPSKIHNKNS